jgi:serine/threonine protein kinase
MPGPATTSDFLDLVVKSNLVDRATIDKTLQRFANAAALKDNPGQLAGLLIREGLLTKFQADQLLQGRYLNLTFGKYKVLDMLGKGGMGSVFLCEHTTMRRRVAIKVLPGSKANDPATVERFYQEARAVGALNHPNIVRAHDVDQIGKNYYLVMEYVEGTDLYEFVRRTGPLDPDRAANYIKQAADGLQHACEARLVHRDVKPANLLLHRNGTVKILDMGLALFFSEKSEQVTAKPGTSVMTVDYVSPEQSENSDAVDIRSDIYSLGATFYYLLTGQPPFADGTTMQKLLWIHMKEPKPVRELRPQVPEAMATVLRKMMAKKREQRYQTPAEVAKALEPWASKPLAPPTDDEMLRSGNTKIVMNKAKTVIQSEKQGFPADVIARLTRAVKNPLFWCGIGGALLGIVLLFIGVLVLILPGRRTEEEKGGTGPTLAALRSPPIASFPFDGHANSDGGKVKPLTLNGGARFGAGKDRLALWLDGKRQFAASDGPLLDTAKPYSVSAWVNWNGNRGYQTILSQDGQTAGAFFLQQQADTGHYYLMATPADASEKLVLADCLIPPSPGTWQHLVGVYTGKELKIYMNGVMGGSISFDKGWSSKGSFIVGACKWEGKRTNFFPGKVDEVKLFDYALSDDEVRSLFKSDGGHVSSLPEGWLALDIGNPKMRGSTTVEASTGQFVVRGGGDDIWGKADQFHLLSRGWSGNGMLVARAMTLAANQNGTGAHDWCKAGVMFRDSMDADAINAGVFVTPHNGVMFHWRPKAGADEEPSKDLQNCQVQGVVPPVWLGLMRKGETLSAFYSKSATTPTATDWKPIGQPVNVRFTRPTIRAGVALTAHNNEQLSFINFADVTIRPLTGNNP